MFQLFSRVDFERAVCEHHAERRRSTLAYSNEHRPWQLYQNLFYHLLARCRSVAGSHGFRFKNQLSLDATLIELCASVFDWPSTNAPMARQVVMLHLLLDHQGPLPSFAVVTEGTLTGLHESRIARSLFPARHYPGLRPWLRCYNDYADSTRLCRRCSCVLGS